MKRAIRSQQAVAPQPAEAEASPELDLTEFLFPQLVNLRDKVEEEIDRRRDQEIAALRDLVERQTAALGVSVETVFGSRHQARITAHKRGKQPARYRGPDGREWSGHGPTPSWLRALITDKTPKEHFLAS